MSEETNFYGSNYVNDKEFVRRIVWLSKKFFNYKLKLSYFYHNESSVKAELDRLNVTYEIKHGPRYDSYAEDIWDYMIVLNLDAQPPSYARGLKEAQTLTFRQCISEKTIPGMIIQTDSPNSCLILRTILSYDSNIWMSTEPEKILREVYDNVYNYHEPTQIELHVYANKDYKSNDPYQVLTVSV